MDIQSFGQDVELRLKELRICLEMESRREIARLVRVLKAGEEEKTVQKKAQLQSQSAQIELELANLKNKVSGVESNLRRLITNLEKMLEEVQGHTGDRERLAREISGLKSDMLKRIEDGDAVWQRKQTEYQQKMRQVLESEYEKKGEEIEALRRQLEIETKRFHQEFQ